MRENNNKNHQQHSRDFNSSDQHSLNSYLTQIESMEDKIIDLTSKMERLESRVHELESAGPPQYQQGPQASQSGDNAIDPEHLDRLKAKKLKMKEKRLAKSSAKRLASAGSNLENAYSNDINTAPQQVQKKILNDQEDEGTATTTTTTTGPKKERYTDKRKSKREFKERLPKRETVPKSSQLANDDSTTQAAEPSSEDKQDGNERDGPPRARVFRRKKQFSRRDNPRRRADSSERNSHDTSPQNELTNGNEEQDGENKANNSHPDRQNKPRKKREYLSKKPRTYPELSEDKLEEIVQALKREMLNSERSIKAIKGTMNEKGPKVVYEFIVQIFDYTICDVTSPSKLSEIANNIYQLVVSEDNMSQVDFQQGFYEAITAISKREQELVIDSPRFMDILGQIFAIVVVSMGESKYKNLVRKFLNKCIESYNEQNRANLLASIMKGIENERSDRFAKEMWDLAQLDWAKILPEGTSLDEFLQTNAVTFTTKTFPPEPVKSKKSSKDLEKFADDVTDMVEGKCEPSALEDLIKNINEEDKIDYLGTLIYAIVRGCVNSDSGDYKLNSEALNKYSSILHSKHEQQDRVALKALTDLTKLWHQHDCPQDLMKLMLMALYSHGTASYEALDNWLNSESLKGIPGIGAARLGTKRYIEELGASAQKS